MPASRTSKTKPASPPAEPLIRVRDLAVGYDGHPILEHMDFEIARGDVFVILGGSGSGKSTVLRHLIGLTSPMAGRIESDLLAARDDEQPPAFGVMFQGGALFSSMTLLENVAVPILRWTQLSRESAESIALARLRLVGLGGFENHHPADISGGMKKRAGIARALALEPPILFLDEPSAGLDPISAVELDEQLLKLNEHLGVTIVLVSHELASLFNLKPFLAGNTAMQPGGWFNTEINSVEDLQGLRFRMPGQGGQVLGVLGASVQNIPGGEIYQALSSGQIDGAEWIGPFADERMGFQEVTKIYYTSGFHEPGSALALSMNLDVWESLTPSQQRVVEVACEATHANNLGLSWSENGAALARLQAAGVQVREFPDDVWDAFGRGAAEVREANMSDPIYKDIADSYFAALDEVSAWFSIGDGEFIRQRNRVNAG